MTFTDLLAQLTQTWPEQPRKVLVLATRYYLGAETITSLRKLSKPYPVHRHEGQPIITEEQAENIINNR